MSKRTRERQLAKHAARRQAERESARRRRSMIVGLVVGGAVVAAALLAFGLMRGGDEAGDGATHTPSVSPSAAAEPGTQTGTVDPVPATTSGDVACGAAEPKGAGRPKPQFSGPPPITIDKKATYTATIETSCGDVVIELLSKRAPQTVNSFVFLAEQGYFDGQYFHRLDESIDVVQGGDPEGTGSGGPGYSIPDELKGNETYGPGTLAMANAGPNTGGSQFFLIAGEDGHNLDGNPAYTIFGHVTEGMDVAKQILGLPIVDPKAAAAGDLSGQRPAKAVYIDRVTIESQKPESKS
jgi:cyclophilin family peptidyl-prolyl cis-trans isomerase